MLNLNDEIVLLRDFNINPTELYIIRLIIDAQESKDDTAVKEYMELPTPPKFADTIKSLQSKNIITSQVNLTYFEYGEYKFNSALIKNIRRSSFKLGEELFNVYPQWGHINGQAIALRSVARKFNSLEDSYRFYSKAIGWSNKKHQEILELVQWAKERDLINFSLCNFMINNSWIDLKAMKDGEISNIGFDSFTDI